MRSTHHLEFMTNTSRFLSRQVNGIVSAQHLKCTAYTLRQSKLDRLCGFWNEANVLLKPRQRSK